MFTTAAFTCYRNIMSSLRFLRLDGRFALPGLLETAGIEDTAASYVEIARSHMKEAGVQPQTAAARRVGATGLRAATDAFPDLCALLPQPVEKLRPGILPAIFKTYTFGARAVAAASRVIPEIHSFPGLTPAHAREVLRTLVYDATLYVDAAESSGVDYLSPIKAIATLSPAEARSEFGSS